jgi:hypothetical protein
LKGFTCSACVPSLFRSANARRRRGVEMVCGSVLAGRATRPQVLLRVRACAGFHLAMRG